MIKSLSISNYALISNLEITFDSGLNIITGETGAGKSIILGALSMLLGEKADVKVLRNPQEKCVIEGVFDITSNDSVRQILSESEIDTDDNTCILRREMMPSGRTRAFVNDTPVNISILQKVSNLLIDIHSQHENLLLRDADFQLRVLDVFSDSVSLRHEYTTAFYQYREALNRYIETRDLINKNIEDKEYLSYQLMQLADAKLVSGELAVLEAQRDILANATKIKGALQGAIENISGDGLSVDVLLSRAIAEVDGIVGLLPDCEPLQQRLRSLKIELADINDSLFSLDESVSGNPAELERVDERLSMLYSLMARHHVDTIESLITIRDALADKIKAINDSDNVLSVLESEARRAKKNATLLARRLSENRAKAALEFCSLLQNEAKPLGLPNLKCEIELVQGKLGVSGYDQVQLRVAFNKNQSLLPINVSASGGEISRLAFSVKSLVASKMCLPTLVFDEVDSGISGEVAFRMGYNMRQMSQSMQLIVITHLPQVAANASAHFRVYKQDSDDVTTTHISRLDRQQQIHEVARMLAGEKVDDAAIQNAQSLISNAINHI